MNIPDNDLEDYKLAAEIRNTPDDHVKIITFWKVPEGGGLEEKKFACRTEVRLELLEAVTAMLGTQGDDFDIDIEATKQKVMVYLYVCYRNHPGSVESLGDLAQVADANDWDGVRTLTESASGPVKEVGQWILAHTSYFEDNEDDDE